MIRSPVLVALATTVFACQASPPPVDQAAVEEAVARWWRDFEQAWERGDLAAVTALYTSDAANFGGIMKTETRSPLGPTGL
jgi:hypothetical protein